MATKSSSSKTETTDYGRRKRPLVATCALGLEGVVAAELAQFDAEHIEQARGAVRFTGDLRVLYNANLRSRSAIRILMPLVNGRIRDRKSLYDLAAKAPWELVFRRGQTFVVDVTGSTPGIDNTAFAALVVKDAIVDRLRERWGSRPSVDREQPDLRVHLRLAGPETTISLDASGEPLSHRGYRPRGGPAPLGEALAAGILQLAGYDGSQALVDPMCGTGTLVVEAALIATRTAPGLKRGFAFQRWFWHDGPLFDRLRQRARERYRPAPQPIVGSDLDKRSVRATWRNLEAAGMETAARVVKADIVDLELPALPSLIVTNPPWGRRIGEVEELQDLYRTIGDTLKQRGQGCTAWLLVGERALANVIGLKAARRIPLHNGPVECRLLRYDLYSGSRKGRPADS